MYCKDFLGKSPCLELNFEKRDCQKDVRDLSSFHLRMLRVYRCRSIHEHSRDTKCWIFWVGSYGYMCKNEHIQKGPLLVGNWRKHYCWLNMPGNLEGVLALFGIKPPLKNTIIQHTLSLFINDNHKTQIQKQKRDM